MMTKARSRRLSRRGDAVTGALIATLPIAGMLAVEGSSVRPSSAKADAKFLAQCGAMGVCVSQPGVRGYVMAVAILTPVSVIADLPSKSTPYQAVSPEEVFATTLVISFFWLITRGVCRTVGLIRPSNAH